MANADREDVQFPIEDLNENSVLTDAISPVPGLFSSKALSATARIVAECDVFEIAFDPSRNSAVELAYLSLKPNSGPKLPFAHSPNSAHSSDAGRVCLSDASHSAMTESAQYCSSRSSR